MILRSLQELRESHGLNAKDSHNPPPRRKGAPRSVFGRWSARLDNISSYIRDGSNEERWGKMMAATFCTHGWFRKIAELFKSHEVLAHRDRYLATLWLIYSTVLLGF